MTQPWPGRSWPGKAMMLAAAALAAVVVAACSGGSSNSVTSAGNPNKGALAYARCMRAHGISDFPDPNAQGGFSAPNGLNPKAPQYATANNACKSLVGSATPPPYNPTVVAKLLKYANCMRAHGLSWLPDPNAQGHLDISFPKGSSPNSAQYTAANHTCSADLPGNGG
ncbi:MAG: hypothetical protein WB800_38735 [Streptosporangiaceae bacterium]